MFLYSKCLACSYFSYCMAGHLLCLYSKWSKRMELNGAGAELGQGSWSMEGQLELAGTPAGI